MGKPLLDAQVTYRDKDIKQLRKFYKGATKKIIRELSSATDFGLAKRQAILRQIDQTLKELDEKTHKWFRDEVEEYYRKYGDEVADVVDGQGLPMSKSFTLIDQEAVEALTGETMRYYREAYSGVKRTSMAMLNKATRQRVTAILAEGKITGDTKRAISDRIAGELKQGLTALVDKGGRKWSFEAYADMLTRTQLVKAANEGVMNTLAKGGYDLVQVSEHANSCPLCAPYQSEILSITGNHPDYETVDDARAGGLFHPNCRHRLLPYHESLAEVSQVWNAEKGRYIKA